MKLTKKLLYNDLFINKISNYTSFIFLQIVKILVEIKYIISDYNKIKFNDICKKHNIPVLFHSFNYSYILNKRMRINTFINIICKKLLFHSKKYDSLLDYNFISSDTNGVSLSLFKVILISNDIESFNTLKTDESILNKILNILDDTLYINKILKKTIDMIMRDVIGCPLYKQQIIFDIESRLVIDRELKRIHIDYRLSVIPVNQKRSTINEIIDLFNQNLYINELVNDSLQFAYDEYKFECISDILRRV